MASNFWRFYGFTDGGRDRIAEWINGLPDPGARARIKTRLSILKAVEELRYPDTRPIRGKAYKGLFEFRISWNRCEYRLIFCYGELKGTVILLAGATHKGQRYNPASVLDTAAHRRQLVVKDGRYLREF